MKRTLVLASLLAFGLAAAAQNTSQAKTDSQAYQAATALSSNGPVSLDYKGMPLQSNDPVEVNIAKQVRHQLLKLPYYDNTTFDDLEYSVQGRTVTLSGAVTSRDSQSRQDAANAVKHIEGVEKVVNNIRVLPTNRYDEEARERVLRALTSTGGLSQYFWPAYPQIHIIVEHQRVTLKGYVNNEGDKNLANIAANHVRDIFQVNNQLQVVR